MNKAIFWDSDGTLLYGNESFKCSLMRAMNEVGAVADEETVRGLMRQICSWHTPEKDHSCLNGEEWWQDLLDEIRLFCIRQGIAPADAGSVCDAFRKKVIAYEYAAYPDAETVLRTFQERGYSNYIISNNFPELKEVFQRLGLDAYISGYVLSASVGYEKPRKEIFEHAIQLAGHPEIRYMIGDNPVADVQGGLAAGMTPVLVHHRQDGVVCCEQLTELLHIIGE